MPGQILVTGATGFLGGAVLRRLAQRGVPAIGQGRDPARCAALKAQGFEVIAHDIQSPLCERSFAGLGRITAIVHCAALSAPFGHRAAFEVANVQGTKNMIDFAQRSGVRRFVQISSPSIYFALRDQVKIAEDMPLPRPFNAYAWSKGVAESVVRNAPEIGPVILRPRGIYGPGDTALLSRLLRAAERGALPRFRDGKAKIDLTYVDDVVDAVLDALRAGPEVHGRAFNVSGGEVTELSDIVEAACARAGIAVRWRPMPLRPALLAARMAETAALLRPGASEPVVTRYGVGLFAFAQSLDISRARNELGWVPKTDFATGLDRTFKRAT